MITFRKLWQSLLGLYDKDEAQAIVRIVLEEKFGLSLTDIVSDGLEHLSDEQNVQLQNIMKSLQKGEPVQYVLGYAYFFGRKFHVEPGVLIPRPETEELCKLVIDDYKSNPSTLNPQSSTILDIGTGSGCIAITLALEIPIATVEAIDISEEALNIAKENSRALGANVRFRKQNILTPSPTGEGWGGAFVSNPPYITSHEKSDMSRNVLDYEPSTALFVPDDDPLLFYRAIADYAIHHLSNNGRLYFEINPLFANELKAMLQNKGFTKVEIINDSFGKQRFAKAKFLE